MIFLLQKLYETALKQVNGDFYSRKNYLRCNEYHLNNDKFLKIRKLKIKNAIV